ncbi:MAG: class I SAM-dependent methyltransferase [Ignavibacteria bacterium]|nr:class I SAM-dependent methyltransferase [Ignavibacteria bacterium]
MGHDKGQVGGKLSPFLERQRIQQATKFIPPDATILDIGCGRAKILEYAPTVKSYVGVDLLDNVLTVNRLRYQQYYFYHVNIENERIPVDGKFDVILMLAILEHLSHPAKTIATILPYLRPNGRLVLTTPHPYAEGIHRLGARLGIFSRDAAEEHTMFFDGRSLRQLANQCGARLLTYHRFQFGLNQVAVFMRQGASS